MEKARYVANELKKAAQTRARKPEYGPLTDECVRYFTAAAVRDCVMYFASARRLNWKRAAKPTKCGPKCWGAKREDCACECEGHNHGIGRAPSAI